MADKDARYNRDEEMKPGAPPRSATEPGGAERSGQSGKTMTDPGSGESLRGGHAPNQARADEAEGRGKA